MSRGSLAPLTALLPLKSWQITWNKIHESTCSVGIFSTSSVLLQENMFTPNYRGISSLLRVAFFIMWVGYPDRYRHLSKIVSIWDWLPFVWMLKMCCSVLFLKCNLMFPQKWLVLSHAGFLNFFFAIAHDSVCVSKPPQRHNDTAELIALFLDLVLAGCFIHQPARWHC